MNSQGTRGARHTLAEEWLQGHQTWQFDVGGIPTSPSAQQVQLELVFSPMRAKSVSAVGGAED